MYCNVFYIMAFTKDEDIVLVENIKITRVLFDMNHKEYDNSGYKGNVWMEISMKLRKPVKQCKKRWKIIKDSYSKGNNDIFQYLDLNFLDETPEEISSLKNNEGEKLIKEVNYMIHGFSQQCINHEDEVFTLDSSAYIQNSSSTEKSRENLIDETFETNLRERNILLSHHMEQQKKLRKNQNLTLINKLGIISFLEQDDKTNNISTNETAGSTSISRYDLEKIILSREKNWILGNLLDQIKALNKKSDITSSLESFFNGFSIDICDLPDYVIDDLKLQIMLLIKRTKNPNLSSTLSPSNNLHSTSQGTSQAISQAEEGQINTIKYQIPILRLNAILSLDLFFKSIIIELQNLNTSAIEEIKNQILSIVSQVKHQYFNEQENGYSGNSIN